MADSEDKHFHLRLLALERDFPKQVAWCRECKAETQALIRAISLENTNFKQQVAEHHSKIDKLLATLTCKKRHN